MRKKMLSKHQTVIFLILSLPMLTSCNSASEETYKFGFVLPLTGTNTFYGQFAKTGAELAIEDINTAGGINGKQVIGIYEDSGGDKTRATNSAQKLAQIDEVNGLFTVTGPMGGAISPIGEENQIPTIYNAATDAFAENKKYVFKDYPDSTDICQTLMKQAIKDGHQKVALFGTNAEFTQLCNQGMEREQPVTIFETYEIGEADFRTQFTKIKNSETTVLVLYMFSEDCLNAYKQIRELDMNVTIYVGFQSLTCGTPEHLQEHSDLFIGAYGSDVALDETRTDKEFLSFKQRVLEKGSSQIKGSAMMYDSVRELAFAYEGCEIAECATNNIRDLQNYQGMSGLISYEGQYVQREVMLLRFEDGTWISAE